MHITALPTLTSLTQTTEEHQTLSNAAGLTVQERPPNFTRTSPESIIECTVPTLPMIYKEINTGHFSCT